MVNASTLTNFSNVTSFTTLGQQANSATQGYFGAGLLFIFWAVTFMAMWNKGEKSTALLASSFLSIFASLMLAAMGWMDFSVVLITVVLFLLSMIIAFFTG